MLPLTYLEIKMKFLKYGLLLLTLPALFLVGCQHESGDERVRMRAEIINIGDRIEVEVLESEYTSGPHWVIVSNKTVIEDKDGKRLGLSSLSVGEVVEIFYNGQVMLSYPPQIVALRIVK